MKALAFAVPFFLAAMFVEYVVAVRRRQPVYRFADTLANLGCGIGSQLSAVFMRLITLPLYAWVVEKYSVIDWGPSTVWPWLLALVGVDFAYYWWHRASHRINLMWAFHVVHHQSEDYNLGVALRQSALTGFTQIWFYLPLALLGVPTEMFVVSVSVSLVYQFWIHTQLVGDLGVLELWLSTPAHHRVHHAVDDGYLDRNHGAILIVWDRLFGTFAAERSKPRYGTTTPLASFNPVWANVHGLLELVDKARCLRHMGDRLRIFIAPPESMVTKDGRLKILPARGRAQGSFWPKYDVAIQRPLLVYLGLQLIIALVLTVYFMMESAGWAWLDVFLFVCVIVLALCAWSGLTEQRDWAPALEHLRLGLTVAAFGLLAIRFENSGIWCCAVALALASWPVYLWARRAR